MTSFHRPRLAEHASLRRYLHHSELRDAEPTHAKHAKHDLFVVHDARGGPTITLDARLGAILLCADGTRDLDGIALAAARDGDYRDIDELRALFEGLASHGLLAEGTNSPLAADASSASDASSPESPESLETRDDRPIERLDFTLVCDGSGVCCTQYPSYAFTEIEAARARVLCPSVLPSSPTRRIFLPLEGSTPRGTFAVASIDGKCAFLRGDGACGIHAAGGPEAKPFSCRLFPMTLFDDGVSLRASVRPECPCVFSSIDRTDGTPVLDPSVTNAAELRGGTIVRVLPPLVPLTRNHSVARQEWARLSRILSTYPVAHDAAATYWALADALEASPFDFPRAQAAFEAREVPKRARAWVTSFARHAESSARSAAQWRTASDRALAGRVRVAESANALLSDSSSSFPSAALAADESFHLRASLFGHLVAERAPVVAALRDRAVRLIVARVLERSPREPHPLALVEVLCRSHGLDAYVFELENT